MNNFSKDIIKIKIANEFKKNWLKDCFMKKINDLNKLKWSKYPIIDAHMHVVDFKQETEWLKKMIYYMNKSNIKKAVIFWMPVIKKWWENEKTKPDYYLEDDNPCYYYGFTDWIVAEEYNKLSKKDQSRFYPLICWFNPTDINAVNHIKNIFKFYPWVFCGIWEILLRHDDLTLMTSWEVARMNNAAIFPILKFATEYDLPVLIHNNISSTWVSDYPKYLHELEIVLREFPKTKIIFAHCWASKKVYAPYYKNMIQRLLEEYPALYIDYSWVVFEEIIAKTKESLKEWIELTEKFNNRILIWSDILGNNFHRIWFINNKFDLLLDKLSTKTRQNICINNAEKLFWSKKNKVEKWYKRKLYTLKNIKI